MAAKPHCCFWPTSGGDEQPELIVMLHKHPKERGTHPPTASGCTKQQVGNQKQWTGGHKCSKEFGLHHHHHHFGPPQSADVSKRSRLATLGTTRGALPTFSMGPWRCEAQSMWLHWLKPLLDLLQMSHYWAKNT